MERSSFRNKIYNSFAFRFNKWNRSLDLKFSVTLNNRNFVIPLINTLGEGNMHLKEDWFFHLIRSLKLQENTDFLDIGVNVGQSLLTFRSCYSNTYWGFEPNPDCVFYIENLVKLNHLEKVNIIPAGLSSENSIVKLYARSDHDSAATILSELKPGLFQPQHAKYVPVFSFKSLRLNIDKIALIKIDVEGAELDVITGMLETIRKHQPVIICEVLDYTAPESKDREQDRATMLYGHLKNLNYNIYRILHKGKGKLEFEEINNLELRKWTPESFDLNDYLFLPQHVTSLPG